MANYTYLVETYLVFLYGGPDGNAGADATIYLDLAGKPSAIAYCRFYPTGVTVPANFQTQHQNGDLMFYLNYRYDQLSNVIDILRNESPVRLFFNGGTLHGDLRTGLEPAGEGEANSA